MDGQLADMVFTDPPYNVDYGNGAKGKLQGKDRRILNDALGDGFYQFLYDACVNLLTVTKGACYICMSSSELHTLAESLHRRRRQVVDLRDLGQEHLHARTVPTTSASTSRSSTAGSRAPTTSGAVRVTRATSGSSTSRGSMTCTRP